MSSMMHVRIATGRPSPSRATTTVDSGRWAVRADPIHHCVEARSRERAGVVTQHFGDVLEGAQPIAHDLAIDAAGCGSSEVPSERFAMTSPQVDLVVFGQEQRPPEKPLPGHNPHRTLPEVLVENLPSRRFRQDDAFCRGSQQERDQHGEALRTPHRCCHETSHRLRTNRVRVERQRAGSRHPCAAVPDPAIWLVLRCCDFAVLVAEYRGEAPHQTSPVRQQPT